jgi:hypothetical protein
MRMQGSVSAAFGCFLLLLSVESQAEGLSAVVGHYRYEQYSVTLPNGRVLGLSDIGATSASLDISATGTITLRMTMKAGNTIEQTAKVSEAHFTGAQGYWVAQWPDMNYPVKAQIRISADTLTSDTQFDSRADTERFGSKEHAVLRKDNGSPDDARK